MYNLLYIDPISGSALIQNNYYFPDLDYRLLNQNISPVNSFRIILN